ncbi:MAG: glycyl-radical enzyme activating protein [Dehalococcoidales bacterium]|nr:glycyl-radical enzyme activating protein [Dehalococcoidales bacterium]
MNSDIKGLVFNTQSFAIQDGPGIRTTVFMKGCPLHCQWCSNPESQKAHPEIMTTDIKCISCRKCAGLCDAISFNSKGRQIDRAKCNLCLKCAEVCPSKAIEQIGKYLTVDEVLKEVLRDEALYRNSGGGMTVSGGEPLLQPEFVTELCRRAKEKGIHTALDTCGYAPWAVMEKVLKYIDLVLFDVKHMDPAKHKKFTGVDNKLILSNLKKTVPMVRTWIRIPLIPGFNDSEDEVKEIAEFSASLKVDKVSVLPYHEFGSAKYAKLGNTYPMQGTASLGEDKVKSVVTSFQQYNLEVEVGG